MHRYNDGARWGDFFVLFCGFEESTPALPAPRRLDVEGGAIAEYTRVFSGPGVQNVAGLTICSPNGWLIFRRMHACALCADTERAWWWCLWPSGRELLRGWFTSSMFSLSEWLQLYPANSQNTERTLYNGRGWGGEHSSSNGASPPACAAPLAALTKGGAPNFGTASLSTCHLTTRRVLILSLVTWPTSINVFATPRNVTVDNLEPGPTPPRPTTAPRRICLRSNAQPPPSAL